MKSEWRLEKKFAWHGELFVTEAHVPHLRRPRWKFTKQPQVARQFFSLRGWRFCWCVFRFVVRKVRDTTVRKPLAPLFLLRPQFCIRAALTLRLRTTKKHRKNRQLRRWATLWQLQLFGATFWQLLMFGATWLNFWQLKGITKSSYNQQSPIGGLGRSTGQTKSIADASLIFSIAIGSSSH